MNVNQHRQRHYWVAGRGVVRPIRVEVERDPSDGHWYVSGPFLMWGCGDTMTLAVEDYRLALSQYREVLSDESLSLGLTEQLAWLDLHLS